ncbi:MAG: hypothetical protein FWG25_10490 [Promicromonosporaceae bacterium]|nr:hypothetical protein [Promicromonosporaceae bacterium]
MSFNVPPVPPINTGWLNGSIGAELGSIVGGLLLLGTLICGIAFVLGIVGWVSARVGVGLGGKDQAFWASRAGLALIAAAVLGALTWAVSFGVRLQDTNHIVAETVIATDFSSVIWT